MKDAALPRPEDFRPAPGLSNAHAQTIWSYYMRRRQTVDTTSEIWEMPDGDVLDVARLPARPGRPLVVVLHGLEGSASAPYVRGMLACLARAGWNGLALCMRSCGPTPSRQGRLYHSGKTDEIDAVMNRLALEHSDVPRGAVGFSMGGNMLLKWLAERSADAPLDAAVGVSVPFDLGLCARRLDRPGLVTTAYRERFLRSLRRKASRRLPAHGGDYRQEDVARARSFALFDEHITARLFGFASAEDYWRRNSSGAFLAQVRRPTLAIAACDDPFVPEAAIPREAITKNPHLELWLTSRGGHVGFLGGTVMRPRFVAEELAMAFLSRQFQR